MKRLAVLAGFLAGAIAGVWWIDHLLGGKGPRLVVLPFDEPGGGFGLWAAGLLSNLRAERQRNNADMMQKGRHGHGPGRRKASTPGGWQW
jgi:hypothetical protein